MFRKSCLAVAIGSVAFAAQAGEVVVYGMAMPFLDHVRTEGATVGVPRDRPSMRDADVVLLLEVGDPFGQFNSISDPWKELRAVSKKDVHIINISMQDVYIRANYQDFQRYMPAATSR